MKTHIFTTQEQEQSLVCEKTKRMPRLTDEERSELSECEKTIQLGQKGTTEVAKALHWVWERRLYREGYRTFRIYCRQRWHREKSYGHDLLRFASIQKQLSAYADIIRLPSCEAHTRPLGCVPEGADRAAIWRPALTMTSHVTGRTVV